MLDLEHPHLPEKIGTCDFCHATISEGDIYSGISISLIEQIRQGVENPLETDFTSISCDSIKCKIAFLAKLNTDKYSLRKTTIDRFMSGDRLFPGIGVYDRKSEEAGLDLKDVASDKLSDGILTCKICGKPTKKGVMKSLEVLVYEGDKITTIDSVELTSSCLDSSCISKFKLPSDFKLS